MKAYFQPAFSPQRLGSAAWGGVGGILGGALYSSILQILRPNLVLSVLSLL